MMKLRLIPLKLFDYVILVLCVSLCVWFSIQIYGNKVIAMCLIIEAPAGKWIYPLDEPKTVHISGALGVTDIEIKNNTACVHSSACPHKNCVAVPPLSRVGDWNACLPNKVFLYID